MEKQKLLLLIFVFVFLVPIALFASRIGPDDGYTGAPGESSCIVCHTGNSLNASGGSLTITGVPASYELDTDYTITVTLSRTGVTRFGFELTAEKTSDNTSTGTLTAGSGSQVSGGYIKQKSDGTDGSGSKSWSFTWRSPSSDVGEIKFYAAGNATNSNGATDGDFIYTTSSSGISLVPVELASFGCIIVNTNDIQLKWETCSETNNYGFDIERSSDNKNFEKIGFVMGNGNTFSEIDYSFTDSGLLPGVYYYRLKQVDYDGTYEYSSIIKTTLKNPDSFSLSQNYPNPFNPETTIEYALPTVSKVNLTIYTIFGQEVKTLISKEQGPGRYSVKWDGTNDGGMKVASGVYLYKINAGKFVSVKKLALLN